MRCCRLFWRYSGLLGLALLLCGCGGRAISKKLARDVIAESPASTLTRNDVDVISVTQMGASEAIVETYLHTAFRLRKTGGEWAVREVRVGKGQWETLDSILSALQRIKAEETQRMLDKIAAAIDAYRLKNRSLPPFTDYVQLSDALYPLYLSPLIREDAWDNPLSAFCPAPNTIRIVSAGPDGRPNTKDDIELTRTYPS
ncbi:MAG: hypothetical protein H6Q05_1723 [Acidobacteria bacterium]|nr:hypothetical protein [Acidobacteriota bacterium]